MKYLLIILFSFSVTGTSAQTSKGIQSKSPEGYYVYSDRKQLDSILEQVILKDLGVSKKPLVLVDKKVLPLEQLKDLKAYRIEEIHVMGEKMALGIYGESGRYGIIFVYLYEVIPGDIVRHAPKKIVGEEDNTVYNFVSMENPPNYPGGIEKFYAYLVSNLKYPIQAAENNIQGNVFVSFTVEKDGSLSDLKIDRKLGYGTDEEAIRLLKLSKRWNPGIENGKPVRVKYNISIKFSLPQ